MISDDFRVMSGVGFEIRRPFDCQKAPNLSLQGLVTNRILVDERYLFTPLFWPMIEVPAIWEATNRYIAFLITHSRLLGSHSLGPLVGGSQAGR